MNLNLHPKKKVDTRQSITDRAYQRLSKLETGRILDWCDQAGTGVARSFSDYRKLGSEESLEEARMGVVTLLVALELLQERRVNVGPPQ